MTVSTMNELKPTTPPPRRTLALKPGARQVSTSFFWFVWSPERRRPRQRHATREAAIAEADRLAKTNPGVMFVAYEARAVERRVVAS